MRGNRGGVGEWVVVSPWERVGGRQKGRGMGFGLASVNERANL